MMLELGLDTVLHTQAFLPTHCPSVRLTDTLIVIVNPQTSAHPHV